MDGDWIWPRLKMDNGCPAEWCWGVLAASAQEPHRHAVKISCVKGSARASPRMPVEDGTVSRRLTQQLNSHRDGTFVRMAQNGVPCDRSFQGTLFAPPKDCDLADFWRGSVGEPRAGKAKPPPKFDISVALFLLSRCMLVLHPLTHLTHCAGLSLQ